MTARESTPEQNDRFPQLAVVIASALNQSEVGYTFAMLSFSDTDPLAPTPARTFLPWDPNDVARLRIEITEPSFLDSPFESL